MVKTENVLKKFFFTADIVTLGIEWNHMCCEYVNINNGSTAAHQYYISIDIYQFTVSKSYCSETLLHMHKRLFLFVLQFAIVDAVRHAVVIWCFQIMVDW